MDMDISISGMRAFIILFLAAMVTLFAVDAAPASSTGIHVVDEDEYGITIKMTIPSFEMEETPDGGCPQPRVGGWARTSEPGYPELPVAGALIRTPESGETSIEVLDSVPGGCELLDLGISSVSGSMPRHDGPKRTEAAPSRRHIGSVSLRSGLYPGRLVGISSKEVMRGITVARRSVLNYTEAAPRHVSPLLSGTACASDPESGPSLRIEVKRNGVYRLTYDDLLGAGVPVDSIFPKNLRLMSRGKDVAMRIGSKRPGTFSRGDHLLFFAEGMDNQFTDTNVYWLYWGKKAKKRMGWIKGGVRGSGAPVNSFRTRLHIEENHLIWHHTPGAPDKDYWFQQTLAAPSTVDFSLSVPSPVSAGEEAVIRVCFQGVTTPSPHPNHHTKILLNGVLIGDEHLGCERGAYPGDELLLGSPRRRPKPSLHRAARRYGSAGRSSPPQLDRDRVPASPRGRGQRAGLQRAG